MDELVWQLFRNAEGTIYTAERQNGMDWATYFGCVSMFQLGIFGCHTVECIENETMKERGDEIWKMRRCEGQTG